MTESLEEKKEPVMEKVEELNISRGEKAEVIVDFEKIRDLFVFDELGNKIRFGDIYKRQKTIIVFSRHFLCFICKDYIEDLALVPLEYLQEADVRLVVIGPAPHKFIKPFKKETGYQYTMYTDPDRAVYKALNMKENTENGPLSESKHVKVGVFMGILTSTWRAMKAQEYQGDVKQQGGALVLGPGEEVHYAHIEGNAADQCAINDLLKAAGVQLVSFPKDTRILDV